MNVNICKVKIELCKSDEKYLYYLNPCITNESDNYCLQSLSIHQKAVWTCSNTNEVTNLADSDAGEVFPLYTQYN